jgi:hypothetical protein
VSRTLHFPEASPNRRRPAKSIPEALLEGVSPLLGLILGVWNCDGVIGQRVQSARGLLDRCGIGLLISRPIIGQESIHFIFDVRNQGISYRIYKTYETYTSLYRIPTLASHMPFASDDIFVCGEFFQGHRTTSV